MSSPEPEVWLPLVDEPIGSIVAEVQQQDAEVARLVESRGRILAFRTFAYLRVGVLLGRLLMEEEVEPYDGSETWVEQLMRRPEHRRLIDEEVRAVAREIAADPRYADEGPLGPDDGARARFREFARKQLG
ncbi:MAG: hypothetical protein ICV67_01430 [Thermoleophilia bacterium]|nr:hypothetical protein [Thermoleophilia bacterium]